MHGAVMITLDQGSTDRPVTVESVSNKLTTVNYVWNPTSLGYEVMVQPSTGSGGGVGGSTVVDANLTSAGSTKLIGQVTVTNPTTSVTLTNPSTAVNVANQPTVDLSSVGSTRLVGRVEINTPTTAVTLSGGSTSNSIGSVALLAGSTANTVGAVAQQGAPWSENITQVAGNSIQTAASGIAKVGNTDSLGQVQYNFPAGFVRTSDEPKQVFYDPFDSALDTTNRWSAPTSSGGGVAAAVSAGVLTLGSGTTANGYSYLTSQASFVPTIPAWLGDSWAIQIESGAAAGNNAVRFWGRGSVTGTPTSAAPLGTGNGAGFKIGTDGVLKAVVYAAGAETIVADLSASQPTDGAYHRYIVYYRTDRIFWYIDSLTTPVATSNFQGPQVQTLPILALAVAHSSAPAASRVISCTGVAVWDTGKNATQLSDGTYPWRKAVVTATGSLSVNVSSGSTSNTVGSVALLAGTTANVIGAVAASSGVVLGPGSTANSIGSVALVAGTSANTVGSVALVAGTSANTIGNVTATQAAGSSGTQAWFMQGVAFSSGNVAITTVNSSVDSSVIAANANRRALSIANLSTVQTVAIGLTTATITTGLANTHIFLAPNSQITFGMPGGFPNYQGPIRAINITSTTVGGGLGVMSFTS